MPTISLLPVGVATSSTPFPANVGSDTSQVTLEPVYTAIAAVASGTVTLTTFAALPAAGTAGKAYIFSDSPYLARDNGSSYDYFFMGTKVTPLDPSGRTWINQGASTLTNTGGLAHLLIPATGTNLRLSLESAPATPWTLTILLRSGFSEVANTQYAGIALRDATGLVYIFYNSSAANLQNTKWTDPTTFSSIGIIDTLYSGSRSWHWLRVSDDGVNLSFYTSVDGVNFFNWGSEGRTAFFAAGPTQIGIFADTDSGDSFPTTFASYTKS